MKKNKIEEFFYKIYKWSPPTILLISALLIISLFATFLKFNLDNDFWFIINTGKYIINNGFPTVEPFTIHSDLEFVVQQWLTDIIFYLTYSKIGIYGMLALMTILNSIIFILLYKICKLISGNKIKLSFVITMITGLIITFFYINTRPQIFDILFFLLELYLLELYINKKKNIYLLGLPLISIFMINLHASTWLMLFVFMVPYFIDGIINLKFFDKEKYKIIPLIITTIIMFTVGLINPYGVEAITYLFRSFGIEAINEMVYEMRTTSINQEIGMVTFIYILFILFTFYFNKKNKIKLRYLLLFFGTCYLALSHNKGILYLLVVGSLPIIYNLKNIAIVDKNEFIYTSKNKNIILIFGILIFIIIYGYMVYKSNLNLENKNSISSIVDYLDKIANKDIKLYTGYDDGGYLEYRGYKCYLDPRAEVFLKSNNKKEDIFLEYYYLQEGFLNYKEFLEKYNFDYLLVSNKDILYQLLDNEENYRYITEMSVGYFEDGRQFSYRLYIRRG